MKRMNFDILKDFMNHLTSWRIPGNSVSVCLGGKEIFSYQSGFANLEKGIPMTGDRLFNIYSCTKVATVTAALQLYEKGLFSLDDPLYDFIPEYREMKIRTESGFVKARNPITLRHLFTMTAGFDYNEHSSAFEKAKEITNGRMNTLTVAKCIAGEPIYFEPGTRWQYSLCHDVLGAVIEIVSGERLRDYMKKSIFLPLGMNETAFHIEELDKSRFAEQYHFKNSDETDSVRLQASGTDFEGGTVINRGVENVDISGCEYDSGGGGLMTSVSDYSKFCNALANRGLGANGERILMPETVDLLRTNQLTREQLADFNWPQLKGYGYGLGVRTLLDKTVSGSNGNHGEFGWGGAAGATVLVDPKINLSVFYAHHMLNPQEGYYQPGLRNAVYECIK